MASFPKKTKKAVTIDAREGLMFWTLWAAFQTVKQDPSHIMSFDSSLRMLLPACLDYDIATMGTVLLPEIKKLHEALDAAGAEPEAAVTSHCYQRLAEEVEKRRS